MSGKSDQFKDDQFQRGFRKGYMEGFKGGFVEGIKERRREGFVEESCCGYGDTICAEGNMVEEISKILKMNEDVLRKTPKNDNLEKLGMDGAGGSLHSENKEF